MMTADPIDLDYNATTPIDPAVVTAMEPYRREDFGTPSRGYRYGYHAPSSASRASPRATFQVATSPTRPHMLHWGPRDRKQRYRASCSVPEAGKRPYEAQPAKPSAGDAG